MIAQGIVIPIFLKEKMRLLKCLNIIRMKLKINLIYKKIKVIKSDKGREYETSFGELCF